MSLFRTLIYVLFFPHEFTEVRKHLHSFISDPTTFIKKSQYLIQSYYLTFHDLYMILSNSLLPKEHRHVWRKGHAHANRMHVTDKTYPMAVPTIDHSGNYNENNGY